MSNSLHIILRCDTRIGADGDRTRCPAYTIAASSTNIAEAREAAAAKGWTWKPGQPYPHINATDTCPDHSKEPR